MRYILDNEGYIESIAFGSYIECSDKSCTEYTGSIPTGYESLCEWADNANIRAYYLVDGNLTYDSNKDQELKARWEEELKNNDRGIKSIITASFSNNHVIAQTDTAEKVNLDTFVVGGEKLTLVDNGILIGSGISKIKVSANVNFQTVTTGLKYITIYKNNEIVSQNPTTISARTTISSSPILVNVAEGDMIYLYVQGTVSDVIRRSIAFSNITVETVE